MVISRQVAVALMTGLLVTLGTVTSVDEVGTDAGFQLEALLQLVLALPVQVAAASNEQRTENKTQKLRLSFKPSG